jgi:predicted permease
LEAQQKEFAHASPRAREQFLKMTVALKPGGGGSNRAEEVLAPSLWMAMGLAGLVLLIACANVANLMISRSAARQKEMAVRLALGAGMGRLVRALLMESALLAAVGGALGFAVAPAAMRLLDGIMPQMDPPIRMINAPNLRVLLFTIAACAVSALIFGLVPALRCAPANPAVTLKDEGGGVIGGGTAGWRKVLVIAQVSLSLVLLTSAGLLARSFANLKDVHPGFDVHSLLAFSVDPTLNGYTAARAKSFYQQLTRDLEALPGVRSAAVCEVPLIAFDNSNTGITVEGYESKQGGEEEPMSNRVSPRFFETLGTPIYAGREFTERDTTGTPKVAIVNQSFAQHYFGSRPAIGRHIGLGTDPGTKTDIEIIGVVGDTKYESMREPMPRQVYLPYLQSQWADAMTAYVRTDHDSSRMFPLFRATVRKLDAGVPLYLMKTEERQVEDSVSVEKLAATLAGAFSLLATFLAAVGLYGVMAFLVTRRTREIGLRIALGAATGKVIGLVLREVLALAGAGVAVGIAVALVVNRLLASQLYGVSPMDPATIVGAIVGITAVAALAAYLPAYRAARIDPVTALRCV